MSALSTLPFLPLSIALWSSYALSLSLRSIRAVRTYEEPTEQAAKYSNVVEDNLKRTRTTEAAGAVATFFSLTTALILTLPPNYLPSSFTASPTAYIPLSLAALNALTAYSARVHIEGFWRGKAKIPMMERYNTAIDSANQLRRALGWMSLAWGMEVVGRGIEMGGG